MLKKIYKILDFFQVVIIKNVLFFITLGILKLLPFKIYEIDMIIKIMIIYILPVFISYTTGNLIEKKYGGINSVIVTIIIQVNIKILSYIYIIIISILVSKSIEKIQKISTKYFWKLEVIIMTIVTPIISVIEGMIFLYVTKYFMRNIILNINIIEYLKINFFIICLITPMIEIAKIFFLNNMINYTILFYLGVREMTEKGSSIFFLLETNPGPGFGVLLAVLIFSKKKEKLFNEGILQFFGGIHEIYFSYILKKIKLLIALIFGALCGNILFYFLNVSLLTMPSPGSVILIFMLGEGKRKELLLGIVVSIVVSFLISYLILKHEKEIDKMEEFNIKISSKKIGVVCNGGIGTSLILKNFLLETIKKNRYNNYKIENYNILEVPDNLDLVIVHNNLKDKIFEKYSKEKIITIDNFLDRKNCDKVISILSKEERYYMDCKININQKKIDSFLSTIEKEFLVLNNNIAILDVKENLIRVNHYPYGVKIQDTEIYLIVIMDLNLIQNNKLKMKLEKLEEEFIENIDTEEEIIEILKEENINVK